MKFRTFFRCKWLGDESTSLSEIAEKLEATARWLREMEEAGVRLEGVMEDDYAHLITENLKVADRYGLENEGEEEDLDDILVATPVTS